MFHDDVGDLCKPSADILGRLLVFQQALDALPDEASISAFARRLLMIVPGVQDAYVHLEGYTEPPGADMAKVFEQCERELHSSLALNIVKADSDAFFFSIDTPANRFGLLVIRIADEALLRPYLAFISNLSNTISRILESRKYQAELASINAQLRQARDELELRVDERTRELAYHVTHDILTGLPNRIVLNDRLRQAIANGQRARQMVAVVYLDLDSFTFVNTGLGNACGDQVLQEIARRLRLLGRDEDTVARIGSDEFVLLLTGLESPARSSARLRAVLAAVREPMELGCVNNVVVTASIGACFYPPDGGDAETLLRRANSAMHRAKLSGKDSLQFYADGRDAPVAERMRLETELRQAIPAGTLVLHYQPKLELETGLVVGSEALVRWTHFDKGLLPPSYFVPIAEESTLIVTLGERVLQQACQQARSWQDAGKDGASVSVNLASRQFRDDAIVRTVRTVLRETGLDPGRLELEITESSVMHDLKQTARLMHALKELGVTVSMDDFGTGYSSLSALRSLPFDKLKIDQSFVAEIETVPSAAAVALTVISFAKNLGMRVIAEGVETTGQADFLKKHRCDEIQGYLVAPPLPAEQVQVLFNQPCAIAVPAA